MTEQWYFLENIIQHYSWGSSDFIPDLLDIENARNLPCAELWLGAHQVSPSIVKTAAGPVAMDTFLQAHASEMLGEVSLSRFGDTLPFLFKVLSASHPLSIQAHPAKKDAERGFARENAQNIPISAPERNYRDTNHKPEIILALTDFTAMCGFRQIEETSALVRETKIRELLSVVAALESSGSYSEFLSGLWNLDKAVKKTILAALSEYLEDIPDSTESNAEKHPFAAVKLLQNEHPDDIQIIAPLYLNTIMLKPDEALFLPAGILHAYLHGTGIELMANSDNVLRGGLTSKHIDSAELLAVLDPSPYCPQRIIPTPGDIRSIYTTPAEEFELSVIQVESHPSALSIHQPSILLVTHGTITISGKDGEKAHIHRGTSLFLPATAGSLSLSGEGIAYMASIPSHRNKC